MPLYFIHLWLSLSHSLSAREKSSGFSNLMPLPLDSFCYERKVQLNGCSVPLRGDLLNPRLVLNEPCWSLTQKSPLTTNGKGLWARGPLRIWPVGNDGAAATTAYKETSIKSSWDILNLMIGWWISDGISEHGNYKGSCTKHLCFYI